MTKNLVFYICFFLVMTMIGAVGADELQPIQLLSPQIDGGKLLMQVLQKRSTSREFSPDLLPPQVLSNCFGQRMELTAPRSESVRFLQPRTVRKLIYMSAWPAAFIFMMPKPIDWNRF